VKNKVWGKLSLREKRLLLLLFAGLIIAAAYHWVWQVQYPRYVALQETLTTEKEKLAQARAVAETLPDLEASRLQADTQLNNLKMKFTGGLGRGMPVIDIGRHLEGLRLLSVSPSEAVSKGNYYETTVNIKVKGTYTQVLSFINALDRMPQVTIKALHLAGEEGAELKPVSAARSTVLAELSLAFYSLTKAPLPSFGKEVTNGRLDLFAPVLPVSAAEPSPGEDRNDPATIPADRIEENFPVNTLPDERNAYSFPVR
jgi:Tfp pilus assembly protein PilO